MLRSSGAKYRRRFYSLYLDTIVVLLLFLLLVLIVWLSMRPTLVLEAREMGKKVAALSKEERAQQKKQFMVHYVTAPKLTPANNPELIAFGSALDKKTIDAEVYYTEYDTGNSLDAPRQKLNTPNVSKSSFTSSEMYRDSLNLEKPLPALGQALNVSSKSNDVDLSENGISYIYWSLPKTISMNNMPNIEPIMRKYGWLSGSLDIMLTVGNEGFVTNVIVYSEDAVDTKLMRELKSKLLALHLGKQNANTALNIGVSWNLP